MEYTISQDIIYVIRYVKSCLFLIWELNKKSEMLFFNFQIFF